MKKVTLEQFEKFEPCWIKSEAGRERLKMIGSRKSEWTAEDILKLEDVSSEDKLWAVLREEFIDASILHEFACRCAEKALSLVESPDPRSVAAIAAKRAWINREISDAELDAAWDAAKCVAWDAAWDAARAAARSAARSVAWDAARAAARAAARSAARSVAWDVAWDAAWDAARSAARSVAWDAVWDAAKCVAWDVAWAAARSAAREFQVKMILNMISAEGEC